MRQGIIPCTIPLLLVAISLAAGGCGHTNELAKYPTSGLTYQTNIQAARSAAGVSVSAGQRTGDSFLDLLGSIGSGIAAIEAEKKLKRAVKPEGVAAAISEAFEEEAVRSLDLRPAAAAEEKPPFIIHTSLEALKLISESNGVFLHIEAEITILHRPDNGVAWQKKEDGDMPIRDISGPPSHPAVELFKEVVSVTRLLSLSEQEIQDAVLAAARGLGMQVGEVLRRDAAGLPRK